MPRGAGRHLLNLIRDNLYQERADNEKTKSTVIDCLPVWDDAFICWLCNAKNLSTSGK